MALINKNYIEELRLETDKLISLINNHILDYKTVLKRQNAKIDGLDQKIQKIEEKMLSVFQYIENEINTANRNKELFIKHQTNKPEGKPLLWTKNQ